MRQETLEQARAILSTLRVLQLRITRTYGQKLRLAGENDTPLCAELTLPQLNATKAIHERGEVSIKELSEMLYVSAPSASAMVDRLVDLGVLVREQSQEDRREVRVRVSASGKRSIQLHEEELLESIMDLLEKLSPQDACKWHEVYRRLREVVEEEPEYRDDSMLENKS